jgi:hypothetical protein
LLCARLRPANRDASAGALEGVKRIVGHLRTQWPAVQITLPACSPNFVTAPWRTGRESGG